MTIQPRKNYAHRNSINSRLDRSGGKQTKHPVSKKHNIRFQLYDNLFVTKGRFKSKYGKYIGVHGGSNNQKIIITFLGEQGHHYINMAFVCKCTFELFHPKNDSSNEGTHGFKIQHGTINFDLPGVVLARGKFPLLNSVRFADGTTSTDRMIDFIHFHPFKIMTCGRGRHRRLL